MFFSEPDHMETPPRQSTDELLRRVQKTSSLPSLLAKHPEDFSPATFPEMLSRLMGERGVTAIELGERSLLSRSFTYQILSGDRQPSRDIVLRVALALGLTLEETQALLRSAQRGALYSRVPRDAVIINALSRHKSLLDTTELLSSLGETPLV